MMTANKVFIEWYFITKCRVVQGGVVEVASGTTQTCPAVSIHNMRVVCRTGHWNTLWSNIQPHKFWSFSSFTSFTLHIIVLFLINSCLWLSTCECCKITRLCSVYTLGIVHVCLGICLLAVSTNKTKKVSFVAKQTSARHVKEALPPSSFFSAEFSAACLPRLLCHSLVPPAKNCQLN